MSKYVNHRQANSPFVTDFLSFDFNSCEIASWFRWKQKHKRKKIGGKGTARRFPIICGACVAREEMSHRQLEFRFIFISMASWSARLKIPGKITTSELTLIATGHLRSFLPFFWIYPYRGISFLSCQEILLLSWEKSSPRAWTMQVPRIYFSLRLLY